MNQVIKDLLELSKVKITFAVSFTTILGYIMAKEAFDLEMIVPVVGLFLLACGSAVLNQYQERDTDALMKRTKNRPIPSGRITPTQALLFAFGLSAGGSLMLYYSSGFLAMQLGVLALLWYNAIYTPLKKKTAFAVVPGSVIGAIPPLVGYVAGGGNPTDPAIVAFAFFMFMWQIPHFWLLVMKFGEQYKEAGLPSMTDIYTDQQIKNITFVWTVSTAVSSLMIPFMGVLNSTVLIISFIAVSFLIVILFSRLVFQKQSGINFIKYFMYINYYLLFVIVALTIGVFI